MPGRSVKTDELAPRQQHFARGAGTSRAWWRAPNLPVARCRHPRAPVRKALPLAYPARTRPADSHGERPARRAGWQQAEKRPARSTPRHSPGRALYATPSSQASSTPLRLPPARTHLPTRRRVLAPDALICARIAAMHGPPAIDATSCHVPCSHLPSKHHSSTLLPGMAPANDVRLRPWVHAPGRPPPFGEPAETEHTVTDSHRQR